VTDPRVVRAKTRLDLLDWYPAPVRIDRVSLRVARWFFALPYLRRFDGYALHRAILVRDANPPDDLVVHELCHVWQMQHHPVRMPLSYLVRGYRDNPFERQARAAVAQTRP
jgi:hypothetical protein